MTKTTHDAEAGTAHLEPWEAVKRRIEREPRGVTSMLRSSELASNEFAAAVRWYEEHRAGLAG